MTWLMKGLDSLSKSTSLILGFLVSLMLGALHFLWGYQLSFSPFYLVSILLVSWHNRLGAILSISAFDALLWQGATFLAGESLADVVVLFWNTFTRFLFFSVIGYLIYKLRESIRTEQALSRRDFLTGALNRRAFDEFMAQVNDHPKDNESLTLVFFDIDKFKRLNDSLGHDVGDRALVRLTETVHQRIDERARFVRLGGDEFCLLLVNLDLASVNEIVGAIDQGFENVCHDQGWDISLSIGIAQSTVPIIDPKQLIKSADTAMYDSKKGK